MITDAQPGLRQTGVIKRMIPERGFGFIAADNGTDVFFHKSAIAGNAANRFPSNTCTCNHDSYMHQDGRCVGGRDGDCTCKEYTRRLSPGALYIGQRVTFGILETEKGPRATDVLPTE